MTLTTNRIRMPLKNAFNQFLKFFESCIVYSLIISYMYTLYFEHTHFSPLPVHSPTPSQLHVPLKERNTKSNVLCPDAWVEGGNPRQLASITASPSASTVHCCCLLGYQGSWAPPFQTVDWPLLCRHPQLCEVMTLCYPGPPCLLPVFPTLWLL